jgi:hypothetical protein
MSNYVDVNLGDSFEAHILQKATNSRTTRKKFNSYAHGFKGATKEDHLTKVLKDVP